MKRVIFTADIHAHLHRTESRDGGQDRLRDGLSALRQTLEYARKYQCPWVFGGDAKVPRRSWPLDALTGWLTVLAEYRDVPAVAIAGNHEGSGEDGSGIRPFASDSVTIVERPGVVDISGVGQVAVWPAVPDPGSVQSFVAECPEKIDVLIGHGMFEGCKLGPDEFRTDHGMTLDAFGMTGPKPRFKVALFGDIHKGQMLSRGKWLPFADSVPVGQAEPCVIRKASPWKGEVIYPGSPYAQTWGEREDGPKGCLLVDLDSGEVTFLPVQAPRYVLDDLRELTSIVTKTPEPIARWRGNFVRVIGNDSWTAEARKALDQVVAVSEPRTFTLELQKKAHTTARAEVHGGMPIGDMLTSYVQARPLTGMDNEHVVAAGLALAESHDG